MRSVFILPIIFLCLAFFSLTILSSIAAQLFLVQIIAFVISFVVFLVISQIPFHSWHRFAPILYASVILLLILTLSIGNITRGSTSWIPLGPVNFQPSQFAKPITILMLSVFLSKHSLRNQKSLLQFLILAGIPVGLIMLEPDLGTSLVFVAGITGILLMSNLQLKYILSGLGSAILLALLAWTFFLQPYQKDRITSFLSPDDPQGAGYNARQALIAVGSGKIVGRGLGHGVQSQLRFLPERHTDFIFASLAEETGLLGSTLLLTLYFLLVLFCMKFMFSVKDRAKYFTIIGLLTLLITQMFINIGMNIGLLPITGITLPLLSYGGSSIIAFGFYFGLLQRIIREERYRRAEHLLTG